MESIENRKPFSLQWFGENTSGELGVDAALPSGETKEVAAPVEEPVSSKEQAFEELIRGEYKDLYEQRVSRIVQNRIKSAKQKEENWNKAQGVFSALAKRYGLEENDFLGMEQALGGEEVSARKQESFLANPGPSVEEIYGELLSQKKALEQQYPSFCLEKELQNPKFATLLRLPQVDMQTAYELTHKEEIIPAVIAATGHLVESRIAKSMASGGLRPAENGNTNKSASLVQKDVSTFTKAQMDDICKRVERGERIYL